MLACREGIPGGCRICGGAYRGVLMKNRVNKKNKTWSRTVQTAIKVSKKGEVETKRYKPILLETISQGPKTNDSVLDVSKTCVFVEEIKSKALRHNTQAPVSGRCNISVVSSNQLGALGRAKSSERTQIFWTTSNSFKLCRAHFSRVGFTHETRPHEKLCATFWLLSNRGFSGMLIKFLTRYYSRGNRCPEQH